jgi:hypothetical protein
VWPSPQLWSRRHFEALEKKRRPVFGTRKKPAITPFQPTVDPTLRLNFS